MGLFRRKNEPEEWIEGIPEGFKTWFWIRLLACGYVIYLGIDLIIKKVNLGLSWGYLAGGIALILVAIVIIIWDIRQYVKLKRALKIKQEEEAEAEENGETVSPASENRKNESAVRGIFMKKEEDSQGKGIRNYARYGAQGEDQEVEADDEVQKLEEAGEMVFSDRVEKKED
ncbi:MAG: hypothetical protein IKQ97_06025 [Eubacterium sp.]|nr:hypothetical protein [Eubacterium sp.]